MNKVTKVEREKIRARAKKILEYWARKDDFIVSDMTREYVIKRLIVEFDISRDRAKLAYGHAKAYWNNPKHRAALISQE